MTASQNPLHDAHDTERPNPSTRILETEGISLDTPEPQLFPEPTCSCDHPCPFSTLLHPSNTNPGSEVPQMRDEEGVMIPPGLEEVFEMYPEFRESFRRRREERRRGAQSNADLDSMTTHPEEDAGGNNGGSSNSRGGAPGYHPDLRTGLHPMLNCDGITQVNSYLQNTILPLATSMLLTQLRSTVRHLQAEKADYTDILTSQSQDLDWHMGMLSMLEEVVHQLKRENQDLAAELEALQAKYSDTIDDAVNARRTRSNHTASASSTRAHTASDARPRARAPRAATFDRMYSSFAFDPLVSTVTFHFDTEPKTSVLRLFDARTLEDVRKHLRAAVATGYRLPMYVHQALRDIEKFPKDRYGHIEECTCVDLQFSPDHALRLDGNGSGPRRRGGAGGKTMDGNGKGKQRDGSPRDERDGPFDECACDVCAEDDEFPNPYAKPVDGSKGLTDSRDRITDGFVWMYKPESLSRPESQGSSLGQLDGTREQYDGVPAVASHPSVYFHRFHDSLINNYLHFDGSGLTPLTHGTRSSKEQRQMHVTPDGQVKYPNTPSLIDDEIVTGISMSGPTCSYARGKN